MGGWRRYWRCWPPPSIRIAFQQALLESRRFPKYVVEMAAIGEVSGRLDEVMLALADYYDGVRSVERSIKSALLYPAIMAIMMLAVLLVIIVKVLPVFHLVFQDLGAGMSPFALALMNFGVLIGENALWISIVVALFFGAVLFCLWNERGRAAAARLGRKLFSGLQKEIGITRFASSMSLMLRSGLDIDASLAMTANVIHDGRIASQIAATRDFIDRGESFPNAVTKSGLFSGLHGAMLTLGFKTGTTDQVMENIARSYEEKVGDRISVLISAIEPIIIAALSVLAGMILLSVILPLMGVMASL